LSYTDTDKPKLNVDATIPKSVMDEINNGQEVSQLDFLEGVFSEKLMIYAVPIFTADDYVCGTAMVCTTSIKLDNLLELMIKTIVVASLWIMLAALVAVYFITERVVRPLREMSKAVKCFAAGDFSARVPVRGKDEIARLAVAVNDMAQSLDNLETMRNTFIGNVSHDLRTPMTTISGFIDGILDGAIPPEKQPYYLELIAGEVRRLSRLVASLLDISRIQAGDRKFTMTAFDICEMARQILISFEQRIDEKQLNIEFECDRDNMTVYADRDAIHQVLYNICDNAVKFASEGGKLSISLKRIKGRKLQVEVFNEGTGISESDINYVFERFYKSDKSRGLNKNGAGLGLFISKTIMDAHGQSIWVKSEYGKNCCFGFTLDAE
jgi:signal transduction histidine kinase